LNIETATEKISSSDEASTTLPLYLIPTIVEVMKVVKDCGVQERTTLMHTTTFLIVNPEFREVFSSLETNEGCHNLIEREREKEMVKCL
jgi:hypothetical protein